MTIPVRAVARHSIHFNRFHPILMLVVLLTFLSTSTWAEDDKMRRADLSRIPNEYIVVLDDSIASEDVQEVARQLSLMHQGELKKTWSAALKGFFVVMTEAHAEALSRNPHVKYVEENAAMYLSSTMPTNVNPVVCDPTTMTNCTAVTDNRLWHLDRADQNLADPNNSYSYCTTGSGVTVYVVDTGVVGAHAEFGGRVQPGYNASGDGMPANDPCLGFAIPPTGFYETLEQNNYFTEVLINGHGTAVASALGGTRVGVAKGVTIVPIKISRCDGPSARDRIPSHQYQTNETVFIVDGNGSIRGTYRAMNTGFTSGSTTNPSQWPTADNATFVDGGVVWQCIPRAQWHDDTQTVQMTIDGLNWILRPENPGPKSNAVVTLSTYRRRIDAGVTSAPAGVPNSLEDAIRNLLANNLTVVASANNQNGDACDTSPGRLSRNNPDPALKNKVITAGGTMIINRPWTTNLNDPPASGGTAADGGGKGLEPAYDPLQGVREGRWICGSGDSDTCSNLTPTSTIALNSNGYFTFTAGSNAGRCVTLFAPAKNLFLATNASANSYRDARLQAAWASGTSWSAPIVAGFAARILQANPTFTPDQVYDKMMANVSEGALDAATLNTRDVNGIEIPGTPNKVLRLADVNITAPPQSTTIAASGPTTFTVGAGGTTALHYQWYQVNPGFDYVTYGRGAHSSTPIGTDSSTLQVTPTAKTAYWVRVTNSCGSADSDIVLAVPPLQVSLTVDKPSPQPEGTTITWTATATGGTPPLQYRFFRNVLSSACCIRQDWSAANTYTWTPAAGDANNYFVEVDVRSAGSTDVDAWKSMNFTITPRPITITSLTADKTSPQPQGTAITWTAVADGGIAPLQYRFWRQDNGGWALVKDYSASNTYTWTPGPGSGGTHRVEVDVRSAGSTADYEATTSVPFTINGITINSLNPDKPLPQPEGVGVSITWTASATGGAAPLQYRFWRQDNGSWGIVQNYSTSNTYTWQPPLGSAGSHRIEVDVKSAGSTNDYDEVYTALFTISTSATVTALVADKAPPLMVGTPITWTATASGGTAPLQYRFWRMDNGGWFIVQDYSTSNTYSWTPGPYSAGTHGIEVDVRSASSVADYEGTQWNPFTISGPVINSLTPSVTLPQPVGTPITWTANVTGGTAPLQYRFWRMDGGSWSVVQNYGTSNTYTWVPPPGSAGSHGIEVDVRSATSVNDYDTTRWDPFTINP